jgi:peroxiredoxin
LRRNNVIIAVMVVLLAGLLALARLRQTHPGTLGNVASAAGSGHPAPDFVLTDLHGNRLKLSDLRGKAVVLNFWATWCPPCKQEIPWFIDLQKRYGSQGLQVVGISMDDGDPKGVVKFAADNSINYPILFGADQVADQYGGIEYLPTTFFIDRNGVVIDHTYGEPERQELEQKIRRAMASTRQTAALVVK